MSAVASQSPAASMYANATALPRMTNMEAPTVQMLDIHIYIYMSAWRCQ